MRSNPAHSHLAHSRYLACLLRPQRGQAGQEAAGACACCPESCWPARRGPFSLSVAPGMQERSACACVGVCACMCVWVHASACVLVSVHVGILCEEGLREQKGTCSLRCLCLAADQLVLDMILILMLVIMLIMSIISKTCYRSSEACCLPTHNPLTRRRIPHLTCCCCSCSWCPCPAKMPLNMGLAAV